MSKSDVQHMFYLGENADKIIKIVEKHGFYCELGREEEFVNNYFNSIKDEVTKKRLLKNLKEANPIIHGKYGMY